MAYAYAAMAGLQIINGLNQAEMTRRQNDLQQRINQMNAKSAEVDALEAQRFGYTQAARYQAVIDKTMGAQAAAYAASGIDASFGTAAEVQEESLLNAFLNTLDIKNQANARAKQLKIEASNIRLGGAMQTSQANMDASIATRQGFFNAAQTGLTGYERANPVKGE